MQLMSEFLARTALIVTMLVMCAGAYCLQQEPPRELPPPQPTSAEILDRIEQLGGRYELNRFGQVDHLNLKCLPISDDDLKILYDLPELKFLNLRGVNQHGGDRFSDEGLRHVGSLKQLEHLNLTFNYLLTDDCTKSLIGLPKLKKLVIGSTRLGRASLPHLARMPQLEMLFLEDVPLDETTLSFFQQMKLKLLYGVKIPDKNLRLLPELPTLTRLPFASSRQIRDTDLRYIRHLKDVDEVYVRLTNGWSDTSQLAHLTRLPRLERVMLRAPDHTFTGPRSDEQIDLGGFAALARVPKLKLLQVPSDDRLLSAVAQCPHIEHLTLQSNGGRLTLDGLQALTNMHHLRELWVEEDLVSDESLALIGQIPTLECLTLHRSTANRPRDDHPTEMPGNLTSSGFEPLTRLPRLRKLSANAWGVDNEVLGVLGRIRTLEELSIGNSNISDAGMMQLRLLSNLKSLSFIGSPNVSMDVCWLLHPYMPECTIADNWCCGCMEITPTNFMPWHLGGSGYIE